MAHASKTGHVFLMSIPGVPTSSLLHDIRQQLPSAYIRVICSDSLISKWQCYKAVGYIRKSCHLARALVEYLQQLNLKQITRIIDKVFSSVTLENTRQITACVSLTWNTDYIGKIGDKPYICRMPQTINAIKHSLTKNTLNETYAHVVRQISIEIKSLAGNSNLNYGQSQYLIGECSHKEAELCTGIVIMPVFYIMPVLAYAVLNVFFPVNINGREWRDKVADEIFSHFEIQKSKIIHATAKETHRIIQQTATAHVAMCTKIEDTLSKDSQLITNKNVYNCKCI